MQEWLYPMGVVLLGYTVLGLTGFGSALVVVPLLAWNWPLPAVVALTLLMDVPASAFQAEQHCLACRHITAVAVRLLEIAQDQPRRRHRPAFG